MKVEVTENNILYKTLVYLLGKIGHFLINSEQEEKMRRIYTIIYAVSTFSHLQRPAYYKSTKITIYSYYYSSISENKTFPGRE